MLQRDGQLAYALLRFVLGVNFFFHGLSRVLPGTGQFAHALVQTFSKAPLPAPLVFAYASTLPWLELALGVLLLVGLFTRAALVVALLEIASLTLGSTLTQQWTAASEQLVYALVFALLLATVAYNRYSADGWRATRQRHG